MGQIAAAQHLLLCFRAKSCRRTKINKLRRLLTATLSLFLTGAALAGPWVDAGDERLRSDIQLLADAGVIKGIVTAWPLSWADVMHDIDTDRDLTPWQSTALARVQAAADAAGANGTVRYTGHVSVAHSPVQIRGFADTPRENAEVAGGIEYASGRYAARLQATWVSNPDDDKRVRPDGSYATVSLGNWLLSATAQDQWWGPGWNSSLIVSSNARPVPSISLYRNLTTPFETKWLSWLGHWGLSIQVGQLESDRAVPDTVLFKMRLTARPTQNLEFGLSRAAQLCGEGRSCGWDIWRRMLQGKDNRDDELSGRDEPGNQLAGFDVRWSSDIRDVPFATYTQWIGEDEAGGFPSKWFALFGAETWGGHDTLGTYRMFFEWSDTMCRFALYKGSENAEPDCTYNNAVYESGYRYRGRSLGSTFDNDASVYSLGTMLTKDNGNSWLMNIRYGKLNRKGDPDPGNTVAADKTDYREVLLTHRRNTRLGEVHLGASYDSRKNTVTSEKDDDVRLFLEWRKATR